MSDPLLLLRAGRPREALEACAKEYAPALGRMCLALLGDQGEAEDAVQETLLAAYRGLGQFRGDGSLRAWLFGIARRQCARRAAQKPVVLEHDDKLADPQRAADRIMRDQERAAWLQRALASLKPTEREAVVLRFQANLSYAEVASACDIDETAARKRVSRGLARLRLLVDPEEVP